MDERYTRIVPEALKLLNTRWLHQGRNPKFGLDCAGVVVEVGKRAGFFSASFEDYNRYKRAPDSNKFEAHFDRYGDRIPKNQVRDGDVAVFGTGLYSFHCGILFYDNGVLKMIHGYYQSGKVVITPIDAKWKSLWRSTFRYKEAV